MMTKNNIINNYLTRHEDYLKKIIFQQNVPSDKFKDAISYVLFNGGKRIRPILVYLCGEIFNININCLDIIAAAIEITHCYSLVHDDLPSMDNDDWRRGKPSCHKAFDEATAILVGDGLQAFAIEILLKNLPEYLNNSQILNICKELVQSSGISGMVSGQYLDLYELLKSDLDINYLCEIHSLKTGKLIISCIKMVIEATNNPQIEIITALNNYANNLGLVFQMQDDYLDSYADSNFLGKNRSSDQQNNKATFAHYYSKLELYNLINDLYKKIYDSLAIIKNNHLNHKNLLELTVFLQNRTN